MPYKLTPTEARAEWIKALRSGEYEQTNGKLRKGDAFCCLGVASISSRDLRVSRNGAESTVEGQP